MSETPLDSFELRQERHRASHIEFNDYKTFYNLLLDFAATERMVFFNNEYNTRDFLKLLKKISFPLVGMDSSSGELLPIIISRDGKNNYSGLLCEKDGTREIKFNSPREVATRFKTIRNMVSDHGYNPDYKGENLEKRIFFISGFEIYSIISEPVSLSNGGEHISPYKRLLNLMKTEKTDIGYIYFYAMLIGLVNLSLPLGIQAIIGMISGGLFFQSVVVLMGLVVVATMIMGWLQILQLSAVETLQQRIFTKAAFEFAFRVPRIKLESLVNFYPPELMNRFFDIITVQKTLPKILIDLSTSALQTFFALILLSFYHPLFILFGVFLVLVLFVVFKTTGPKALETSIVESKYKYKVVHWLEELARTISTFKLAGFTNLPLEKMDENVSSYLKYRQAHFKILKKQFTSIVLFKTFITGALLILGGYLVVDRQINLGQFVAAEIIIVLIIASVEKLINSLDSIYDLLTAVEKVGHVTDLPIEKKGGINVQEISRFSKGFDIEIKNLSYKYVGRNNYALNDINLFIQPGERLAITGYNGSGKSTLIKILTGLLHDYEGLITFNHISLKNINVVSFRDFIGDNLSQEEIFEGTVEENIHMGKDGINEEDVLWAVDKLGLTNYINSLPNGIKSELIAGGAGLPQNIIQKLILARSVVEQPKLLVIDEFFYNAEIKEKNEIMNFLFDPSNPWTMLIISHDPSILQRCDRVIMLRDGQKITEGAYDVIKEKVEFKELMLLGSY